VEGSVFAGNRATLSGGGLAVGYAEALIRSCTFSANEGPLSGTTLYAALAGASLTLDRCIVTGSTGTGFPVTCTVGTTVTASCTDVFGNAGGDWVGCLAGQDGIPGNFAADPLFCDAAALDFTLQADSPCAPGGSACGLVGAEDVGCGPTALVAISWGAIKARYGGGR
jgi:hypothetical protein